MKTFLTLVLLFVFKFSMSQVEVISPELKYIPMNRAEGDCTGEIKFDPAIHKNIPLGTSDFFPAMAWPLGQTLNNGIVLVNYVDDQTGSTITDYMGNSWSYNGHNGTDLSLHSFRDMDRFVTVKAAASGTVEQIRFNEFDRNMGCTGTANIVLIRHDDGSYGYYFHLMRKSVIVKVGEYVQQGKILGYVGSSGCSTDAHLHIECGSFVNGNWVKRDPWHGTFNTLPTLWQSQAGYIGDDDFRMHDMGVFTSTSVGGNINNISSEQYKERIIDPVTISGYEPQIGVWILAQGLDGDSYQIEMRKPNGTLFKTVNINLYDNAQYAWWVWTPTFNVGVDDTGLWYARVVSGGTERMRVNFNVQLLTSIRPRLSPVSGKCFRKSIFVQRDTLRVRPVRTNMQYDLLNAPANVTLVNDSILTIGAFDQTTRSRSFKVIASLGGNASLRDTMEYLLVDTTKNQSVSNGIVSMEMNALLEGLWNGTTMVSDTVRVLLRTASSPYSLVDYADVNLNSNGFAIVNFPDAAPSTNYYIVVRHRNSIETWSANTKSFPDGFPGTYTFSSSSGQAYGNNMKLKSGKFCFYTGDVNQDNNVDVADLVAINNDLSFFSQGYVPADLDGDDFVDSADLTLAYNNSKNFVTRVRP
ncbi:MAG: peptidoglycan DD-metalloendopeptidase family protein [bacterium]